MTARSDRGLAGHASEFTVDEHEGARRAVHADARRVIETQLSPEVLAELHTPSRLADAALLLGVPLAVVATAVAVGLVQSWLAIVALIVLQGIFLLWMMFVLHDLFVHRNVVRGRLAWIASLVYSLPVQILPAVYRRLHVVHHRFVGTERDSEIYKRAIDTTAKRLLFLTFAGVLASRCSPHPSARRAPPVASPRRAASVRRERRVLWIFNLVLLPLSIVLWPRLVLLGYLVPLLVVVPIINTVRVVLEHFEMDANNQFYPAIFYRCGPVTRWLFLSSAGDCHLVHHLYPAIPLYKLSRAAVLMAPVLRAYGVIERRSLVDLLGSWFFRQGVHGVPQRLGSDSVSSTRR